MYRNNFILGGTYGNSIDIKSSGSWYINISVLNMILDKVDRKDWVTLTTLVGIVIVLGLVITEISDLFNTVRTMFQLY